jgi:hypothetical protein
VSVPPREVGTARSVLPRRTRSGCPSSERTCARSSALLFHVRSISNPPRALRPVTRPPGHASRCGRAHHGRPADVTLRLLVDPDRDGSRAVRRSPCRPRSGIHVEMDVRLCRDQVRERGMKTRLAVTVFSPGCSMAAPVAQQPAPNPAANPPRVPLVQRIAIPHRAQGSTASTALPCPSGRNPPTNDDRLDRPVH